MEDKLLKKQLPMRRVLYALAPVCAASIYYFGWRALAMLAVVNLFAFASEYAFCRYYKQSVTEAVFVTGTLLTLTLPPNLPFWMAALAAVFAIVFAKMVFGGFGSNVFNPALAGRAFIYINFSTWMLADFYQPFSGFPGGISHWKVDAVCSATPLKVMSSGHAFELLPLIGGSTAGCLGETCSVLIILGGLYILWKKAANYRIVVACLASTAILQSILYFCSMPRAIGPLHSFFAGGYMLGVFFMATDPVSACKTNAGRWIYGALIGVLTVIIRTFSVWPEGIMFAILLANMFAPLTDYLVKLKPGAKK